jgi:hypothetical protein
MNINLQPSINCFPDVNNEENTYVCVDIYDRNPARMGGVLKLVASADSTLLLDTREVPEESAKELTAKILIYLAHRICPEAIDHLVKLGNTDFGLPV